MIDVAHDHLIPLFACEPGNPSVAHRFNRSRDTIRRWLRHGLEAVQLGGTWYTTADALNAFAKRSQPVAQAAAPLKRTRHQEAVIALRREFGIG